MNDNRQGEANPATEALGTKNEAWESTYDPETALAATDDVDSLNQQIERTRAEMQGTINAIQEKLDPQALKQQAKDAVRAASIGRVESAVKAAGDNMHQAVHTLDERTSAIREGATQQAQRVVSTVRATGERLLPGDDLDRPHEASGDVRQTPRLWYARAKQAGPAVSEALHGAEAQIRRHPLASSCLALALGTVIGRSLPRRD